MGSKSTDSTEGGENVATKTKGRGYESGPKKVGDLKPPPKNMGAGVKPNGVSRKKGRSLTEYVRARRREACAVCRLPDDIREQIKAAQGKKVGRETILDWLTDEHGIKLTGDEYTSHASAHHDRREDQ